MFWSDHHSGFYSCFVRCLSTSCPLCRSANAECIAVIGFESHWRECMISLKSAPILSVDKISNVNCIYKIPLWFSYPKLSDMKDNFPLNYCDIEMLTISTRTCITLVL